MGKHMGLLLPVTTQHESRSRGGRWPPYFAPLLAFSPCVSGIHPTANSSQVHPERRVPSLDVFVEENARYALKSPDCLVA